MEQKQSTNNPYLDLEIINKFESQEEYLETKPVLLSNSNGLVIYANSSIKKFFGIKTGYNLFELNSDPKFSNLFDRLTKSKVNSFFSDLQIERKDGYNENHLLNIEKVLINEEEFFIVYLDSQENRKKISKKVNSYNQALESVSVGVLIADQNANIKYVSTSFENFFNIRIEEIYNKNIKYVFKKYLSEFEIDELDYCIVKNKKWVKVINGFSNEGEAQYREVRLNISEDKIDKSVNYIVTVNDITKHVQQARLLKNSEERQKSIINNISDPILILKKVKGNLIIENANNNFINDILGKKIGSQEQALLELINPVLHSILHEAILILEDSNRIHAPFHYTSPINNKRFLGKITFTDDHYDNTRLYIINMSDITEQLEIEKKLRDAYKKEISLNKLKSTFLANMSHEIRTPLNAIVGYSDLLEDDVKAMNFESSTKMTSYLKEGVNRLLKLVDNIVEVSLLESGNEEINLSRINLNHMLNVNKSVWIEDAKLKNISIKFDFSPMKLCIEANEEKLERAVKEVIDNAIKYNVENGEILVSTYEEINENYLQVSDTGIGIEKESLNKIFHMFEQVEETGYTRKYEGAGLGLSLANKLVSFMNGKMSIVSQPNEGTIITIAFPKV
ncbi:MAG: PAS domain-containing sensor histidine kinase [Ignavibacteriae bacterium]|nr:PAS domain-containing sensor histidine kinase [Ignavibacteriota bacterium]MCB9206079.1 PAS domain-containing sensor histidine kinase [Ignavibacteriales bacterium]MCB9209352.1 PAS domain-containing sensor histidine kinase [Ignavibacteriales bacterium]